MSSCSEALRHLQHTTTSQTWPRKLRWTTSPYSRAAPSSEMAPSKVRSSSCASCCLLAWYSRCLAASRRSRTSGEMAPTAAAASASSRRLAAESAAPAPPEQATPEYVPPFIGGAAAHSLPIGSRTALRRSQTDAPTSLRPSGGGSRSWLLNGSEAVRHWMTLPRKQVLPRFTRPRCGIALRSEAVAVVGGPSYSARRSWRSSRPKVCNSSRRSCGTSSPRAVRSFTRSSSAASASAATPMARAHPPPASRARPCQRGRVARLNPNWLQSLSLPLSLSIYIFVHLHIYIYI